jgi:hypothetical protein
MGGNAPERWEVALISTSFPEDGHSAVIWFADAVCLLPDMHTFEVVVVQQMVATVFKPVDSIQFKVAERARPGFI